MERMTAVFKLALLYLGTVTLCLGAVAPKGKVYPWEKAEVKVEIGHYPQPYCSLTNVVLRADDGFFYYQSEDDLLSEQCPAIKEVWNVRHRADLKEATCSHTYSTGYAYTLYYWYTNSNYFHLHYDALFPLYEEFYYNQKPHQKDDTRVAFLPTVESARLEKLNWETDAFDDPNKYWVEIAEFIAGKHDNFPLQKDLLSGLELCFKEIKFGTPRVDYGDKHFVRSFVKWVKDNMGIEERPLQHERLGIIARSTRRRIINQEELKTALQERVDTDLIVLEDMTFKEQVQAMQNYSILVGVNGAGLMNCIYLPTNSVCIQIVPYKAEVNYQQYAELLLSRGHYLEWHNRNAELNKPVPGDYNSNYPDTVVDVNDFTEVVLEALEMNRYMRPRDEL